MRACACVCVCAMHKVDELYFVVGLVFHLDYLPVAVSTLYDGDDGSSSRAAANNDRRTHWFGVLCTPQYRTTHTWICSMLSRSWSR